MNPKDPMDGTDSMDPKDGTDSMDHTDDGNSRTRRGTFERRVGFF
jgi:hypothetical protein